MDMTYKNYLTIILLFALTVMANNANAEVVALFDATTEISPQPIAGDQTASVVNTALTTNGAYNTRSIAIGGTSTPHRSGIVPSSAAVNDGSFYVQSSVTLANHNIIAPSAAFHEFSITVDESQLNLDTLSFNYWASEGAQNDSEIDTDFTYSVRAHAEVIGENGSSGFQNLQLSSTNLGSDQLQILNLANTNAPQSTFRSNVVEYDVLSQLGTLNQNDVVNFRLSFADETTGGGLGPDDNSHIHRLDNVQLDATSVGSVPEPSSLSLLLSGFGILALRRRR